MNGWENLRSDNKDNKGETRTENGNRTKKIKKMKEMDPAYTASIQSEVGDPHAVHPRTKYIGKARLTQFRNSSPLSGTPPLHGGSPAPSNHIGRLNFTFNVPLKPKSILCG